MKKLLLFILTAVAVTCAFFGVSRLFEPEVKVNAEVIVAGKAPTLSSTKRLVSTDGAFMLLATGINDPDDCYELGYFIGGAEGVTYNVAKYYSSISINDGATVWTSKDIFGVQYDGMIVWEIKNLFTEISYQAYARYYDYVDGVPMSSENIVYGTEKSVNAVVKYTAGLVENRIMVLNEPIGNFNASKRILTFKYKDIGVDSEDNTIQFTVQTIKWLRITDLITVDICSNSPDIGSVESAGNGWYKVSINCSDMPINTAESDGTEKAGLIYFNTVNRDVLISEVGFEYDHSGAATFASGSGNSFYLNFTSLTADGATPINRIINVDVKFDDMSDNNNKIAFTLHTKDGWPSRYYGHYVVQVDSTKEIGARLHNAGFANNVGATLSRLDDGWYRVTIDLSLAACGSGSGGAPDTNGNGTGNIRVGAIRVDSSDIYHTNTSGYIKYMGVETNYITAVNGTGGGTYEKGATATVTAAPPSMMKFKEWQVNGVRVSTDATYSFTVTEDVDLEAVCVIDHDDASAFAYDKDKDTSFYISFTPYLVADGATAINKTIVIDVKFDDMSDNNNKIAFTLNVADGWPNRYYGHYVVQVDSTKEIGARLHNAGFANNVGATLSRLDDGWYRVTIDLSLAACGSGSGGAPNTKGDGTGNTRVGAIRVDAKDIYHTNTSGYIKYMGVLE